MESRSMQVCDTIYYQGMISSQTQALKYVGNKKIKATTGELMWCDGKNNLAPLRVIDRLYLGKEIADVNLSPFASYYDVFNPLNWIGSAISWCSNWMNGMQFMSAENPVPQSVKFHAPVLSNISIGQGTDIESHKEKYNSWRQQDDRADSLILYGVSRGTAATFCAFAKHKYPEVKLVVLEGAIDSVNEVLSKRAAKKCGSGYTAAAFKGIIHSGLSLFTSYDAGGITPLSCVADYPENVPTVFITSNNDDEVPRENTENLAIALAKKGKNDVYLLVLEHSSHPNYMFDDREDRDRYEAFMHAIYEKYGLQHDSDLANKGREYVDDALLSRPRASNKLMSGM